ncbi:MAG: hypothetical protein ACK47N_05370 [Microcystis sp.]|jgi:hypothetical protein|uniref:hypothetical protein n=1 Tax=Microcystis sp. TaxID=1127 RepID=UPI00391B4F37
MIALFHHQKAIAIPQKLLIPKRDRPLHSYPKQWQFGSLIICVISRSERVATNLTYIETINLCVLCAFVVRSTWSRVASALRPPARLYLRIHFTHQT